MRRKTKFNVLVLRNVFLLILYRKPIVKSTYILNIWLSYNSRILQVLEIRFRIYIKGWHFFLGKELKS